jgi:hypothetical protein
MPIGRGMIVSEKSLFSGAYYNLLPIFHDLNQRFFKKQIAADLRWGIRRTSRRKLSLRLGSYHPESKTIIIHPCLDQSMVPLICVERILFHEMLHQYMPAKKEACGKMKIHHQEFNNFEKNYPYLREADLWIKTNLSKLLSS